jgi:hypothetical protein
MIVIFDTNIWLSQLGMRSPAASAVRFYLKHSGARLALPEVIRLEVEANLRRKLMEFIKDIQDSHRQLLTVFGTLPEVVLPTSERVEATIQEILESTGVEVITVPFSLESARSSLLKTINKEQPSDKTQEFKDGVLWADCLTLLATDDVTLVTDDRAFYFGRQHDKGLAENLKAETADLSHRLRIVNTLAGLLETLPKSVPIDDEALFAAVLDKAEPNVTNFVSGGGFDLGEISSVTRNIYATENPDELFFECSISVGCPDKSALGRDEGVLVLEADGFYIPASRACKEVGMKSVTFNYQTSEGASEQRRGHYLRAGGGVLGHRSVTNVVRHRLED